MKTSEKSESQEKTRYLVKTKGYKETFDSLDKARNQFEILKKRAIKNHNEIRIELFEKTETGSNLIDEIRITEDFYSAQE